MAGLVPPTHVFDYGELEDARWFTRDWLVSYTDDDSFRMPRLDSIARRLIEDWLRRRCPAAGVSVTGGAGDAGG